MTRPTPQEQQRRQRQARRVHTLSQPWAAHPAQLVHAPTRVNAQRTKIAYRVEACDSRRAADTCPPDAKIGVLIFGSARRPGGGWLNGARAQEEDVSLVSTWATQAEGCPAFYAARVPWGPNAALVAEGAWLLDGEGHPLPTPVPVVFGGVAAPNRLAREVANANEEDLQHALTTRLVGMLDAWHGLGVTHAVLGAIGAGVFQWPAEASAKAVQAAVCATVWTGEVVLAMPGPVQRDVFDEIWQAKPGERHSRFRSRKPQP